eukprot:scaffold13.g333.t1
MALPDPPPAAAHANAGQGGADLRFVILGGSVAGFLTAAAAARHGRVLVLERDDLSRRVEEESHAETAKRRAGTPQQAQPHGIVAGGLEAFETLLPGLVAEMESKGGRVMPINGSASRLFMQGGSVTVAGADPRVRYLGISRRLAEQTIRERVLRQFPGRVALHDNVRFTGLTWDEDHTAVTGVELAGREAVPADVVIDCSGRFTRVPDWLSDAGWAPPPKKIVDSKTFVFSYGQDRAPRDWEGYLEFSRGVPDPAFHAALAACEPLTPVAHYATTANVARLWEAAPPPPGLLALGDSVQALNPVFGCVVGWGRARHTLAGATTLEQRRGALRGGGAAWHRRAARVNSQAWDIVCSEDARLPTSVCTDVRPLPAVAAAYIDAIVRLARVDRQTFDAFWRANGMTGPLTAVFHPRIVLKVAFLLIKEALGLAARHPGAAPLASKAQSAGAAAAAEQ